MLLDWHQVPVVYLNLLLSFYNVFCNNCSLANNQLYNHLLDQSGYFKCFHMFLYNFWLVVKKIPSMDYNIIIFYFSSWKKTSWMSYPSRQVLVPRTSWGRPPPTSPGRCLKIPFDHPGDVPKWCPGDVLIWCSRDVPGWLIRDVP